ncbi:MAG TPA: hypothetical protein V6C84_31045 [Coleofasciculaceae cyanobacterium]|jgi:hypothetical protein
MKFAMKPASLGSYVEILSIKKSYRINSSRELAVNIIYRVGAKSSAINLTGEDALAMMNEDMPEVTEELLKWIDGDTE